MSEVDLDALRNELSEFAVPIKTGGYTAREERIIAGFEDIQRFVDEHGRVPQHGEDRDIFERLYAVRLERIRALPEAETLLAGLDHQGLLAGGAVAMVQIGTPSVEELAAELADVREEDDIRKLRHVVTREEKRAADEIANRTPCPDFRDFEPLFEKVNLNLSVGLVEARPFGRDIRINRGDFFVLGGQLVYVAAKGAEFKTPQGEPDARLRVIYGNRTESNLLMRSLQRALYKDESGRRIVDNSAPSLFGPELEAGDEQTGTIYVIRSNSTHPFVEKNRELVHKIGVTGGNVTARLAGASKDATFLLADVEIVATYSLARLNRVKLEAIFHRVFSRAQIDITIEDRLGNPVKPKEWFLVPLHVIDEVVRRILDGSITEVEYDPATARLVAFQ